jgi:hypothetical protein
MLPRAHIRPDPRRSAAAAGHCMQQLGSITIGSENCTCGVRLRLRSRGRTRARRRSAQALGAAPVTGRVAVAARPVMHAAACVRRCAAGEGVTGIHANSWRFTRGGAAPAVGTSDTGFCLCPGRGGVLRALLLACTHARTRAPPPAAAAAAAASLQERKIIARRRTGFPCPGPGLTACSSCPTNHIGPVPILACVVYPQLRT